MSALDDARAVLADEWFAVSAIAYRRTLAALVAECESERAITGRATPLTREEITDLIERYAGPYPGGT